MDVITDTVAAAPAASRDPKPLSRAALAWNHEGFRFRSAWVDLPAGVTVQDLHDYSRTLWTTIQATKDKALRRFDRISFLGYQEAFLVHDALVIDADATSVTLSIKPGDIYQLPGRGETWEDSTVRIYHDGGAGFVVQMKLTGAIMLSGFHTLEAGKSAYFASQPRRVA
jgi:hypothetical protein